MVNHGSSNNARILACADHSSSSNALTSEYSSTYSPTLRLRWSLGIFLVMRKRQFSAAVQVGFTMLWKESTWLYLFFRMIYYAALSCVFLFLPLNVKVFKLAMWRQSDHVWGLLVVPRLRTWGPALALCVIAILAKDPHTIHFSQ